MMALCGFGTSVLSLCESDFYHSMIVKKNRRRVGEQSSALSVDLAKVSVIQRIMFDMIARLRQTS